MNIPKNGTDPTNSTVNIINEHTHISKKMIELWASNTVLGGMIDQRAQNNKNITICIRNKLTKNFLAAIDLKELAYTINRTIVALLLIKIILQNAKMDTMVTSAMIRTDLQYLDNKMVEL